MGAGAVIAEVDERGAVYLGAERYLAGECHPLGGVSSYVPGHAGKCRDVDDLISRWEAFKFELPNYDTVTDPGTARESVPANAQRNEHVASTDDIREHLRGKLGRSEKQSERMKKANEKRRQGKGYVPW